MDVHVEPPLTPVSGTYMQALEGDAVSERDNQNRDRLGILRLGESEIRAYFDLPDGFELVSVWADPDRRCIAVMVRSDSLPVAQEFAQAPNLDGNWQREVYVEPGERNPPRLWYRMRWERDS